MNDDSRLRSRTADRRQKIQAMLRAHDLDAFIASAPANVTYLTGFSGDSSSLLVTNERAIVISDGRFTTQLAQECPDLEADIRRPGEESTQALARVIDAIGVRRVGFEALSRTVADHEAIQEAARTTDWAPTHGWVESLREIKDDLEIAAIRQAVQYAEDAFAGLLTTLRIGDSEKKTADDLEIHLRKAGATGSSFPPIVAVGQRSALPHARPTDEARIGDDDFVLVDWGATGRPYKSDLTRVLVTGKVTTTFEKIYRIVLEAQERAIAAIRPGAHRGDVDATARGVVENAGYGPFFDHGLGHGLGLEIHEGPRLRRGAQGLLAAGMVVTVEPGIYLAEWGGIRIEDDVLVTPDGHEVLSRVPRSLESTPLPNIPAAASPAR